MRDPGGSWLPVETGVTDADGRLRFAAETAGGVYRLTFATGPYFADRGRAGFYPEVVITFSAVTLDDAAGPLPRAAAALPLRLLDLPGQLARARLTRASSQTGSAVSRTTPSAPKTRNRSKVRANQRSWVTASTVPS